MSYAINERDYWDSLTGDEIEANTAGFPPYDAEAAAAYIVEKLPLREFSRWLDLGCGTGRLTRAVARFVPSIEITGVDISSNLLTKAKMSRDPCVGCNIMYRVGDGRTLPDRCGLFDAAYSVTMFQHIPRDAQRGYIDEVAAHLRPGALFIFTVAVGDTDVFLNHQVTPGIMGAWLDEAALDIVDEDSDIRGWHWVMAKKSDG